MLFKGGGHSKGGGVVLQGGSFKRGGRLLSKGGRGRGHSKGVEGGVFLNGGGLLFKGGVIQKGGGEVATFEGALETYTNTCGKRRRLHTFLLSCGIAASLEPCGVRMKDMN